jgi:hypothetical protein
MSVISIILIPQQSQVVQMHYYQLFFFALEEVRDQIV